MGPPRGTYAPCFPNKLGRFSRRSSCRCCAVLWSASAPLRRTHSTSAAAVSWLGGRRWHFPVSTALLPGFGRWTGAAPTRPSLSYASCRARNTDPRSTPRGGAVAVPITQHHTATGAPMLPWSFSSSPLGGCGGSPNAETTRPLSATAAFKTKPTYKLPTSGIPLPIPGSQLLTSGGRASARP